MAGKRPETYWVTRPEQLAALTSARRHDIVDRLAAGGPMSIKQLAQQTGAKPSALYHHVEKLLGVGLVVDAGRRVVRRRHEQLYATPAPRMRLIKALADGQQPELMAEIVASLTRQMARDFRSAGQSPARVADGEDANYGFFRLVGRPTPAQLARINACLLEIAEVFWNSNEASSPLVGLGWVIAPLETGREDGT
ncbi:MAG: helix-turn-helix domain-containing protein [Woeseia sp.]